MPKKANLFYLTQTAPRGSSLYYSLLYTPTTEREAIILIVAFYQAIYHILFNCRELSIAQTKLNWWKQQVDKMFTEEADHPIAQALQTHAKKLQLNKLQFLEIIQGMETFLMAPIFPSQQEVYHHYCHTAGARELLIANVLQAPIDTRQLRQVAAGLETIHQIHTLHYTTRHSYCFFDEKSLTENQVTLATLKQAKTTHNIKTLLNSQSMLAKQYLCELQNLPHNTYIRAKIALELLAKIEKKNFKSLEKNIQLPPLKKLWIAWRNKKTT